MEDWVIYAITFLFGYLVLKKFIQWRNLPPGPWGLPVVGYLPFLDRLQPHKSLTKLSKQYGPVYGISMGSIYAVVLSDQKLIRDAFSKDVFSGRAPLWFTHGIMHGNGIICAEGGLWKDQRKLVTAWLKSFGVIKHGVSREKLGNYMTSNIQRLDDMIAKSAGSPMDLISLLSETLGNIVNDIVFGYQFPPNDKTSKWFRNIQEEGCHELGVAGVLNFLPFLRFISPSLRKPIDMIKKGQAQTHRLYAAIVDRRRKELGLRMPKEAEYPPHANLFQEHLEGQIKCITYGKNSTTNEAHYFNPDVLIAKEGECVLDNFLLEQKRRFDGGDETAKYMTDEQLLYLLADLFGAGLDTTHSTTSWFFLYIALYQDEQDIVRDEILSVYPEESAVDHTNLPKLMAAISESQRIRTIVPVGIPHGSLEDTYIGDYKIPKGTMVIPLQWALHMDPDIWDDPEEFRPSRFLAPDGSLLKPKEFIPFQTGKRMCPGDELSRMLAASLIAQTLRRYRVRLACEPPTPEKMEGSVGLTLGAPTVTYYCDPL